MRIKDLQAALQAVHPGAILVSSRVLDRGLQYRFSLPTYRIWDIPHRSSLVVDRHKLVSFIEPDDLEVHPDQVLPDRVILLAKPTAELENQVNDETLLSIYWRRLFHACIHLELERQLTSGELNGQRIRERIDALGPIIWAEARKVLVEEDWLTATATEEAFYIEFVAVFLELKFFLPNVTGAYFPAIQDPHRVERIVSEGLDSDTLFARTHLRGARDPAPLEDPGTDEANDYFNRLVDQAKRYAKQENHVRAAILRIRASRVAPAERTRTTREEATADMRALVTRLQKALEFDPVKFDEWVAHLDTLLEKADQDQFPVEADLLRDLQNACQDHERPIYTLSVADWALSGGKRPVQRVLLSQQHVLVLRHLRNAQGRLTDARITQQERDNLNALIDESLQHREARLRERYRPVLRAALEDSGFHPRSVPEQAAQEKLIEEILDRFIEAGYFSFGDLRDIIVRNQMKMSDVASAEELVRGDALLQLDRRLAIVLDGVYRPGESYLRALERVTSLFFGTQLGRFLTRYLLLPFGVGFLLTQTVIVMSHLLGGLSFLPSRWKGFLEAVEVFSFHGDKWPWNVGISVGLGVLLLAFLYWTWFKQLAWRWLSGLGQALTFLLVQIPREIAQSSLYQSFLQSWPVQLFYWLLMTPLLLTLLLWIVVPEWFPSWGRAAGIFVLVLALIGTRLGRGMLILFSVAVGRLIEVFREGLLQGVIRWISDGFQRLVRIVEGFFHWVDELLRFRAGQSDFTRIARLVLSLIWWPFSALARFYFLVLIEPGFNPIKMPISIVMAKLMNPVWFLLFAMLPDPIGLSIFGYALWAFAVATITLLPDAVTFLLWELSSNWQLYEVNRPAALKPVVVGLHGETMRGLLQPGFHSGTVPGLFQRLRRIKRALFRPQSWQLVRLYERHLEEVERAIQQFVTRNLLALLKRNKFWEGMGVRVEGVHLAVSSIRVELAHPHYPSRPLVLEFALQDGWLVGGMASRGWFDDLQADQLWPLNTALAALYKLAGVQLVRDQIQRNLGSGVAGFEITRAGLVVWPESQHAREVMYFWDLPEDPLVPRHRGSRTPAESNGFRRIPVTNLIFDRVPLLWKDFVTALDNESGSRQHANVLPTAVRLVVAGKTTIMERQLDTPSGQRPPGSAPGASEGRRLGE